MAVKKTRGTESKEGGGGGQRLISDKHFGSQRLSGVFITLAPLIISGPRRASYWLIHRRLGPRERREGVRKHTTEAADWTKPLSVTLKAM